MLRLTATAVLLTLCYSAARGENTPSQMASGSDDRKEGIIESGGEDMAPKELVLKESQALVEPLIQFTSTLFGKIRSDEKNIVLSPISIHAAFNLVALGAESNSVTDQEIRKVLGYPVDASQEQLDEYHKAYKKALEKFREISNAGLKALERAQSEKPGSMDRSRGPKPPVVDFYNTLITKQSNSLLSQYSQRSAKFYNSTVEQINATKPETVSKVVDKINKWGKDAGFEQNILNADELTGGDFAAMLLSAVRVQAFWFNDFSESQEEGIFHDYGLQDKPVKGSRLYKSDIRAKFVEFCTEDQAEFKMHYRSLKKDSGDALKELASLNFTAIELPLQGNVSLTIFEPKANGQGKELRELTQKLLEGNRLEKVLKVVGHPSSANNVDFFEMPKFGFENDIDLKEPLQSIGMSRVFDRTRSELSKILQDEPVYVDKASHQAMIDVNKFGLKAAGVTKIRFVPLSAVLRQEHIILRVNNPFMFLIRYEQVPLFIGQLVKLGK